jgi:hypothetical protein
VINIGPRSRSNQLVTLRPGESRLIRRHYLEPQEQVIIETHPSRWFYFPGPVSAAILVAFIDYWLGTRVDSAWPPLGALTQWLTHVPNPDLGFGLTPLTLLAIVLSLAVVGFTLGRWYLWAADTYAVTNERLIEQKGIFRHVIEEIPLQQVRDMNVYQRSFWARVFRVGTIRVQSLSEIELPPAVTTPAVTRAGETAGISPLYTFKSLEKILDPKDELARASGIEWWVGVPDPFGIERKTQSATRAASRPGTASGTSTV